MPGTIATVLSVLFFLASRLHQVAATPSQDFLPQGFFFDWNPPGTTVPIPVTQQCETLHITWQRGSTAVGPNPTSPYFLQIFTSTFIVPITVPAGGGTSFDFAVPWIPGTQYQICMWDSRGVSGGCQDIYTVIPNTTTTAPTCSNVTYPTSALNVNAAVINGAFSEYGWVPQCTDIQVEAQNGTGPYTLMVAPSLHPPLNLTKSSGPINWTVVMTHGFSFFISGPLHSGDNADTSCLDINHSGSSGSSTKLPVTIGAAVGGVVVGLLAGAAGVFLFRRSRRSRQRESGQPFIRDSHSSGQAPQSAQISPTSNPTSITGGTGLEYIVEPFAMPSSSSDPSFPLLPGHAARSAGASPPDATSASSNDPADPSNASGARRTNVYVVHHDGGRAPVTVYTEEGAEVVELPPRYPDGGSGSGNTESDGSRDTNTNRRRQPASVPRKARGPRPPT
ncbi:hypothetical protein F5148DRAFT_1164029 [Russula earlei]|uniref:Uncharacterized protein n=1 Tax=Russula earlei TaxID=71964 RepID=A0ACC0UML8_9AGAM|nr:hypothetical protein F5148DRAFT_1164029 [Russula earlei]